MHALSSWSPGRSICLAQAQENRLLFTHNVLGVLFICLPLSLSVAACVVSIIVGDASDIRRVLCKYCCTFCSFRPSSQMKGKSEFLDDDGEFDGVKAYGAVLGTFLVCSWVEIVLAFIKPNVGGLVYAAPVLLGSTPRVIQPNQPQRPHVLCPPLHFDTARL